MKKTRAKKRPANLRTLNVFSTGQAARICRCCIGTIIENIEEGLLKGYRLPGSTHRRVTRDELARYMGAYGLPLEWLPKP